MDKELLKKLNTTGAFDGPWLRAQLENWDVTKEQQKADFMEHMYQCSRRVDKKIKHPDQGLYSGLWKTFCITEAGPIMRDRYFEMQEAIRLYEAGQLEPSDPSNCLV
jgi:hypothetical protein